MKRLLLATSILALTAGGAFAQGVNNGSSAAPRTGTTSAAPTTPGTSPSASGSSSMSSSTMGSSSTGSAANDSSVSGSQASADDVMKAQQVLKQQGLYKGQVDGKIGPETRTAISQFQKKNGLQQTAQLDQKTMDDLEGGGGISSGKSGSAGRMPANTSARPGAASPTMSGGTGGNDKDDDNDAH